jgi:hypothetical protein
VRGVVKAWGFYAAGVVTVLLALYLYTRRLYFTLERSAAELGDS